ncbi:hypothetical protein R5W24_002448 [Gemmata sp. JC717]|uniref:Transmembrane protein n=1 Tax=Gemmata algarum TaxID=2975278 RepID=A0ABU5EZH5_9BACT|nr:hypothetical protein [Gemmata algarum]MDY3553347.1 hypothetical protein [Gemmata algarum]MDY3559905.1 hypothetical protein [Gemmata algarum]
MTTHSQPRTGWIVSPAFDLFFLANLGWLLLLLPGFASRSDTAIDFWQIYFLTLPHRWITLVLVATDPDRREARTRTLAVVAALFAVLVIGAFLGTGAFLCLALVDFVWNAWHFGSQHAGVLRMYTRKVGGGSEFLERWGLRAFVVYAALRAAEWAAGWLETDSAARAFFAVSDFAILTLPAALLLTNVAGASRARAGKLAYLTSVCVLYTVFILSLHFGWTGLIVACAAAGSMFHAVEYLAVVTHYARRRESVGSPGRFRTLARYWVLFLATYALVLGSTGVWLSRPDSGLAVLWQGLNLWAAFVHYAFDGMIWKLRRPDTAAALGVSG